MIVENRWNLTVDETKRYEEILSDFLRMESIGSEIYLSELNFSPYRLQKFLELKGYVHGDYDTNGWEMDFWVTFTKENCVPVQMSGCGMTFELFLRYSDDDEPI